MNPDTLKPAPIFEIKLQNGETLISEILDIDIEDTTMMLYWPLKVINRTEGSFLSRWFVSNKDPWIQLERNKIIAIGECLDEMKTKYTLCVMQYNGMLDGDVPDPDAADNLYH
jgi:hypothetical protein